MIAPRRFDLQSQDPCQAKLRLKERAMDRATGAAHAGRRQGAASAAGRNVWPLWTVFELVAAQDAETALPAQNGTRIGVLFGGVWLAEPPPCRSIRPSVGVLAASSRM
jgi:hypothetical protein